MTNTIIQTQTHTHTRSSDKNNKILPPYLFLFSRHHQCSVDRLLELPNCWRSCFIWSKKRSRSCVGALTRFWDMCANELGGKFDADGGNGDPAEVGGARDMKLVA